jgi:hypothetical protein
MTSTPSSGEHGRHPEPQLKLIQFDVDLHAEGERVNVRPFALRQALAWWVGAELVRRHPNSLHLIKTYPGGGQYDCLTVVQRTDTAHQPYRIRAYLNMIEMGHITLSGPQDVEVDYGEERFNWLEVLLARDRRKYVVKQLERALDFSAPGVTPPTTAQSIGVRLISRFLASTILDERRWTAQHGLDDWYQTPSEMFSLIPGLDPPRGSPDGWHSANAFWFLCPNEYPTEAIAAIDAWRGLLWDRNGRRVDLMTRYKSLDRVLDRLVVDVLSTAK